MDARECLIGLKGYSEKYTLDDAVLMLAYCADRGLTPFYEVYPVLTDYTTKKGDRVRQVSFKEHYSVLQRWAQQSGGYSAPVRTCVRGQGVDKYGKPVDGWIATVKVITNRDYAALIKLAQQIPGFDFKAEREAFLHTGEAFVPADHYPPAGKTVQWVAYKRAEEEALRRAFGREPRDARQMYAGALTAAAAHEAADALYPPVERPALTVAATDDVLEGSVRVVDADPQPAPEPQPETEATFMSPEEAWDWAVKKGAFADAKAAAEIYGNVRNERKPSNAAEMSSYWRSEVARILATKPKEVQW